MKAFLGKILFQSPTPFPWLIAIFIPILVFYIVIGVFGIIQGTEVSMAILVVPFLLPKLALLMMGDLLLRRILNDKLKPVWIIESTLILLWGCWYAYENLRTTRFVTKGLTPLIVMVEDASGTPPETRFMGMRNTYRSGEDNVIVTDRFPNDCDTPLKSDQWFS